MSKVINKNSPIKKLKKPQRKNIYDICMHAVLSTNDNIINNKDCIERLGQLKNSNGKKHKYYKISNEKKSPTKVMQKNKSTKSELKSKEEQEKELNVQEKKKKDVDENDDKGENYQKYFKGKQTRYTVFKHIMEYLESNDITLNDVINNNPFQKKPFMISGGSEFIDAVKFENYNNVATAIQKNINYLFVYDYMGQTAYHWAAKLGNLKILELLVKYGKHHNQKDFKGRTPLFLAALNNNIEICKFLINNGANPFLYDNKNKTPADVAEEDELKIFLKEHMSQPFSNPIYRAKIKKSLVTLK